MYLRTVIAGLLLLAALAGYAQSDYYPERVATVDVRVFPNPAPEYVHIQLGELSADKVHIKLHTVIGNEAPVEIEKLDDHQVRLRVKDLPTGYYFISLKDEETKFRRTYKFLKH